MERQALVGLNIYTYGLLVVGANYVNIISRCNGMMVLKYMSHGAERNGSPEIL